MKKELESSFIFSRGTLAKKGVSSVIPMVTMKSNNQFTIWKSILESSGREIFRFGIEYADIYLQFSKQTIVLNLKQSRVRILHNKRKRLTMNASAISNTIYTFVSWAVTNLQAYLVGSTWILFFAGWPQLKYKYTFVVQLMIFTIIHFLKRVLSIRTLSKN